MKKIDALAILSLLCGGAGPIRLEAVGNLYLAELLLLPLLIITLVIKGGSTIPRLGMFWVFLIAGVASLVGYMISDLVVGTEPSQYLRGWGRVILLIVNCVALIALVSHGIRYLWCFVLGWGLVGIVYLLSTGVPLNVWKLGYGEYAGMVVVSVCSIFPRAFASFGMLTFGVINLLLDYRNLGAVSVIVAAAMWAASSSEQGQVRLVYRYIKLAITASVPVIIVSAILAVTLDEFGERRNISNVGRTASIVVSLKAIADSPIIGYGSWTQNEEYARLLRKEYRERLGAGNVNRMNYDSTFRAHSQILQSWIEGGVLGATFFIAYGFFLIKAGYRLIFSVPVNNYFPLLSYFILLGAWNLLASPFGGDQRLLVAVVAACIAAVMLADMVPGEAPAKASIDREKNSSDRRRPARVLRNRVR